MSYIVNAILALIILAAPFLLTGWNIFALVQYILKKKEKPYLWMFEVMAMLIGLCFYLLTYAEILSDIRLLENWDKQLYNSELHSFIAPDTYPTIHAVIMVALAGYIAIRAIPARRQAPIVSAAGIAAVYLGAGLCVVFCIQTLENFDFFLILLPINCLILFYKAIYILMVKKNELLQDGTSATKHKKLAEILNKSAHLPWIALILLLPLLGIIIAVMSLFGQEPHSIIKAWTETADWTLSQKIAPQNIQSDHYLCTVAAGGHRKVVKPLRSGLRHGHPVIVNRQLCVANAFEQVLMEKQPGLHKVVRGVYDTIGFPISKHIKSQYAADLIYFIMKPLEWLFIIVLYTVDVHPEDRIAVQYPHTKIPDR